MARGAKLQFPRKAGAFNDGDLYAGEFGLDVTAGQWYFSRNGTTVEELEANATGPITLGLNDLEDVELASLAEGNILSYNATSQKFINRTPGQAGLVTTTEKGSANGVATLGSDGKIPTAQLPALAITSVSVVADNAARDALTVQAGDVAIVTGSGETYIYDGTVWRELKTTEAHTHAASDITSGNLAAERMQQNVGTALNNSPAVTINNPNLVIDCGTL